MLLTVLFLTAFPRRVLPRHSLWRTSQSKETYVPCVNDFKLLQILGEGYEGKVLHARKKDCGVMYALKVLDKQILAQRSRRRVPAALSSLF